jgi:hypothetical protein
MKPCARCRRHVRRSEAACPFCGAALLDAPAPAPAAWSLGLVVFTAACGPGASGGESDTDDSSTGGPSQTVTQGPEPTPTTSDSSESSTTATDTTACDTACVDSSEGGSFIYASPDMGPIGECDQWVQDCPGEQKCVPVASDGSSSWNDLKCVPVMGAGQPGDPCTTTPLGQSGLDDCAFGSYCWSVDEAGAGTCVALCTGSPDAPMCDPGTVCSITNQGVLSLCLLTCDPLAMDCAAGDVCVFDDDQNGFRCVFDGSEDGGQLHGGCVFINGCDPGLACVPSAGAAECDQGQSRCCEPYCDLTAPDPDIACTGAGQVCQPWFAMDPPTGLEDVGVCFVPR